ncbi:MAG: calcium-binding protein, partial [Actinomycetota bacterium]
GGTTAGGSDTIADFTTGTDKLNLTTSGTVSISYTGSSAVVTSDSGTITLLGVTSLGTSDISILGGGSLVSPSAPSVVTFSSTGAGLYDFSGSQVAINFVGGSAAENVIGSSFNDTLFAQDGADTVNGGAGNDWISGGSGADLLTGGAGNDLFVYSNPNEGGDTITDFVTGDVLRFQSANFGNITSVNYQAVTSTSFNIGGANFVDFTGIASITSLNAAIDQFAVQPGAAGPAFILYKNGLGNSVLAFDSNGTAALGGSDLASFQGSVSLTPNNITFF